MNKVGLRWFFSLAIEYNGRDNAGAGLSLGRGQGGMVKAERTAEGIALHDAQLIRKLPPFCHKPVSKADATLVI